MGRDGGRRRRGFVGLVIPFQCSVEYFRNLTQIDAIMVRLVVLSWLSADCGASSALDWSSAVFVHASIHL